jgi:hypothetical protein
MKCGNLKSLSCAAVFCCATLLFCFSAQVSGQEDGTSLMLEMTPAEGGYLNIAQGVHTFDMYAEVTLKAIPKPGYQFVCWLGSVSDTATSSTTVFLDSPKMVIAVFERSKFDTVELEDDYIFSGDGGGLVRSGGASDTSLEMAVSGTPQDEFNGPHIPHKVPVPEDNGETDPPVPVPEPATITLLFAGFLILTNRRKNGVNLTDKM